MVTMTPGLVRGYREHEYAATTSMKTSTTKPKAPPRSHSDRPHVQRHGHSHAESDISQQQHRRQQEAMIPLVELAAKELSSLLDKQESGTESVRQRFPRACMALVQGMEGNNRCIDCKRTNPQWASVSYGTLICLNCSGNHRSLGVNVSTVRSITMDHFTYNEVLRMLEGGNTQLESFFQRHDLVLKTPATNNFQQPIQQLQHQQPNQKQLFYSPQLTQENVTLMRYKTKASLFYRQQLERHVNNIMTRGPYKGRIRKGTTITKSCDKTKATTQAATRDDSKNTSSSTSSSSPPPSPRPHLRCRLLGTQSSNLE